MNDNDYINESAFEVVLSTLKRGADQKPISPYLTACEITWALIEAGHLPVQPRKPH